VGHSEGNRDFTAHAVRAPAVARQAAGQGLVSAALRAFMNGRAAPESIVAKRPSPGTREPIAQPGEGIAKNGIMPVSRPVPREHRVLLDFRAIPAPSPARPTMIYSMTGYASATRELVANSGNGATSVSVELRTVNSRFLDLNFRMPDDVRVCEPALREMLMNKLSRGKVDVRINLQRSEQMSQAGALNRAALDQLAELERAVLESFPDSERLRTGEILRWPGVLAESGVSAEALREAVLACGKEATGELVVVRQREGAQLATMLLGNVTEMEAIVARITPLVPELIARHQQKIVERLQEALGLAAPEGGQTVVTREEAAERIRQEVTMYGIRIDIAEELSRLTAHLNETRHVIEKGGRVGKRLDFMMQELNREANTLGSKAAAKELADASMALKLLIEQMREQVQNLE
jgi:uncharacterized protein (TIGR00255 family)